MAICNCLGEVVSSPWLESLLSPLYQGLYPICFLNKFNTKLKTQA